MTAIILEADSHSRRVLTTLLHSLGYTSVFAASDINEADFYFCRNPDRIRLILYSSSPEEGGDLPLSQLVVQRPEMDFAPLIQMSNRRLRQSFLVFRTPLVRVDDYLSKPFGAIQLKRSISRGHRRRAELRSTLLVLSNSLGPRIGEALYTWKASVHWKEVVSVSSPDAFETKLDSNRFRVGAIILDPALCNSSIISWLIRFKRTLIGAATPVALLSRAPERTLELRQQCNLFFDRPEREDSYAAEDVSIHLGWPEILKILSNRILFGQDAKEIITTCRQGIKAGRLDYAEKLANLGLAHDPARWEFQELVGTIAAKRGNRGEAIERFKTALATNPCSPYSYLNLVRLLDGSERKKILEVGSAYCPFHPQLRSTIASLGSSHD